MNNAHEMERKAKDLFDKSEAWSNYEDGWRERTLPDSTRIVIRYSGAAYVPLMEFRGGLPEGYGADSCKTLEAAKGNAWAMFKGRLLLDA